MKKNIIKQAFTLIELLVVIWIIWIIFIAWSQVNLNNITDSNKLLIFNNKIISQFELIRNNTLLWKWININVSVPERWKISYSSSDNWAIKPSYLSWSIWIEYLENNLDIQEFHSIKQINCLNINWWIINSNVSNAEIIIEWNEFIISWACWVNSKILEIETQFRNDTEIIQINSLNGLIEIQ